ncbi:aldehyde dehydrogenase [Sphingomonas sp. MG17]|uniref:Aldehyde dehydrogenase n=1 Tax=Sphingomonas tagetis TaxID=2949092 RepID=A0A9X2HI35_9SPHN|nr:aldehyde dehydrogenase [Sphingomonas tagetis]MCP3730027.1 aldehyde dehydrogenase [Sphingomonas tagetis]
MRIDAPLAAPDRFFIGGQWVRPLGERMIDVIAPATEQCFVRVAAAEIADIDRAVAAAREAFDAGPWPRMHHVERAGYLEAFADALEQRLADLAFVWPYEAGIVHTLAQAFLADSSRMYRDYARMAEIFVFEERHLRKGGGGIGLLVHEPVGVVGAIIPWNGPVNLIATKIAPALLAGCTIVIKASPEAPCAPLIIAEVAAQIGLPPGVLNVVTADRAASGALVRNPDVDKIAFTGSSEAGKSIAAQMGARMGRYTMELGGKSAALVLDDYDLEKAASQLTHSVTRLSGQICTTLSRIIVPRHRHDMLVDALVDQFERVRVGDPFDPDVTMGPLATARHHARVSGYIERAMAAGQCIATGGGRPAGLDRGFYLQPTLFADVDNASEIAQDEIFGPVICVIAAQDEDDAIDMANRSRFGLSGAIFSNDADRVYALARRVRTGTVGQNSGSGDFSIAFGGVKESGIGREGGVEGLRAYLEPKTILLEGAPCRNRPS